MTIIDNSTTNELEHRSTATSNTLDVVAPVVPIHRIVRLPQRFDVHQVDAVLDELRSHTESSTTADIDGSLVEMIDLAALRSLEAAIADQQIRIVEPSVALRMTAEYTGHALASACFAIGHELGEVA